MPRLTSAMRFIAAVLVLAPTTLAHVATSQAPKLEAGSTHGSRPNILVIVTDDQRRAGTLGVMPTTRQRFGKEGTQFVNAFASTPMCCPSRATLFTGRYAHNHRLLRSDADPVVFDQSRTLQARLQDSGYATAIVGKYLNAWNQSDAPPHFDRWAFFSKGYQPGTNGYFDVTFNVDGALRKVHRYSTSFVADQALRYMDEFEASDDKPWFLYIAPYAPHTPATPQPFYRDVPVPEWHPSPSVYETDLADKPDYMQDRDVTIAKTRRIRRRQLRSLMSVDAMIGDIFRSLAARGEERNTLALFLSDNGRMWAEHQRDRKGVPYTESVAIPLLIRWPGEVPRGVVDDRLVATVDVAPTILDAAGIADWADEVDGRSLLDGSWQRDRLLLEYWISEGNNTPTWASLRTKTFQYIEYYEDDTPTAEPVETEYYDLVRDPWQMNNRFVDGDPDPDGSLSSQLSRDRGCAGSSCP